MKTSNATNLQVTIQVPVEVEEPERAAFERALVEFLFGRDHIRAELAGPLAERGVDVNQVARLADGQALGVCPTPDALEFVPSERVARAAREYGVDLTSGGRVFLSFDYDSAKGEGSGDALRIELGLSGGFAGRVDDEFTRDVVHALFGDCQLSPQAQDYLRAHGVDLSEVASENADLLRGGEVPPTTRVSPQIAKILDARGFATDRFGRFDVTTIRDLEPEGTIDPDSAGISWSKATCC